jgi:TIR domain-containing protein
MEQGAAPSLLEPASAYSDLPALNWRDATGARVFYCDAFVSHRRGDASAELIPLLADRSVRAWHDDNADLSHRNVRTHIRFALSSSRTIVVCVSADKSISGWCRAEYLPGLLAGEKANFERVIVVLFEQGAFVPEELRKCTTFLARDIDKLAKYLLKANRPPLVEESGIRGRLQPQFTLGELPFTEISFLGKQRLDVLANSGSDDPRPWEEWGRDLFANDLGVPAGGWPDDNHELSPAVVEPLWDLYHHLGNALLQQGDVVVRLAPFEIVDFVLAPLGWLQKKPACAIPARLLIAELCLAVAENSDYAQRAAAWLVLSESISKNFSFGDARKAMEAALDDVYEQERHLKSVAKCGSSDESDKSRQLSQKRQSEGIEHCRLAVARLTSAPS